MYIHFLDFEEVVKQYNYQIQQNRNMMYVELENHFWVGVVLQNFQPLNRNTDSLVIGCMSDDECVDEIMSENDSRFIAQLMRYVYY